MEVRRRQRGRTVRVVETCREDEEEKNELESISEKLDEIVARGIDTQTRLEKLERLRQIENTRRIEDVNRKQRRPNALDAGPPPSRPISTVYRPRKKQTFRSQARNVTFEQVLESIQGLREEIAILNENHEFMEGQIRAIKRLIQ
jgi:hypothetical protein